MAVDQNRKSNAVYNVIKLAAQCYKLNFHQFLVLFMPSFLARFMHTSIHCPCSVFDDAHSLAFV